MVAVATEEEVDSEVVCMESTVELASHRLVVPEVASVLAALVVVAMVVAIVLAPSANPGEETSVLAPVAVLSEASPVVVMAMVVKLYFFFSLFFFKQV